MDKESVSFPQRVSTKQHIANCLCHLLCTSSLEDITVQEIIMTAGICKATFYRYYVDKYDVIVWDYMQMVSKNEKQAASFYESVLLNLKAIQSSPAYIKALMYKGQNSLSEHMLNYSNEKMFKMARKALGISEGELPEEYTNAIVYHNAGCRGLRDRWISSGLKDDYETVTKAMLEDMPELIKPFFLEQV